MDSITTIAKATSSRKSVKAKKQVKCHRPRKESTKTITTRLYRMWSDIVKYMFDNHCAICHEPDSKEHPLNAHHIMPRQNFSGLRFNPINGIALCPKCHKFGKYSAHKGGIWFSEWLRMNDEKAYEFCLSHHTDELDCKDRMALYAWEYFLVHSYIDATDPLDFFKIQGVRRDGEIVNSVVEAYNAKSAETIFWNNWPSKSEIPLKGIVKTEKVKMPDPSHVDKIVAMKNDLESRGIVDENMNLVNKQEVGKSMDLAKVSIVQEATK